MLAEQAAPRIAPLSDESSLPQFDHRAVTKLFDGLAPTYWLNCVLSVGLTSYWRKRCVAAARVVQASSVCDVCTGTGEALPLIRHLAGPHARLTALDCSPRMLERAAARKGTDAVLLCEDLRSTSLKTSSVDAVTCCFGWKLLSGASALEAIREVDRILMPGGTFAAVEFVQPAGSILRFLYRAYIQTSVVLASLISPRCCWHKSLVRYLDHFDGFDATSEHFRLLGYTVSETSLTGGVAQVLCAMKPGYSAMRNPT